jgi:hypothetical protein
LEQTVQRRGFSATVVLLTALAGCGDGLTRVSVEGKITAKGKPIDNAAIQFIPTGATKGEGGIGRSDSAGNFILTGSRQGHQGIVPGEYKVRVMRLVGLDGSILPPDAKEVENPSKETVPAPYASAESPLRVTVPDAGGPVTIDIPEALLDRK